MKKCRLLLLLLLLCQGVWAQTANRYVFNRFGKINGLAADDAVSVTQDREGYIWIATGNGLQRYDGKRFITFRHNPAAPNALPTSNIAFVLLDKKGRLWVECEGSRIGIFDTKSFRYYPARISLPEEARRNELLRITADSDNTLQLVVANYGVITYNEQRNEFSAAFNKAKAPDGSVAGDIRKYGNSNKYWVTHVKGIDLFDAQTQRFIPRASMPMLVSINQKLEAERALGPIYTFTDQQGILRMQIWSNKQVGPDLLSYDIRHNKLLSYKTNLDDLIGSYHDLYGSLEQKNGDLWVYGAPLFAHFNKEKGRFEDVRNESLREHGVDIEKVYHLFEDREENIWVSSSNGLYVFNPSAQVFTNIPNRRNDDRKYNHSPESILQRADGSIYVSAWGAGIFAYDPAFNILPNPFFPMPRQNDAISVWDMLERKNGEIWMGMQGGSLRIYDMLRNTQNTLHLGAFEKHTLRQVREAPNGDIWIGTQTGLILKCKGGNWKDTTSFSIVQRVQGNIMQLLPDNKGNVWACSDRDGLFRIEAASGKIMEHFSDKGPAGKKLNSGGATNILQVNDSTMLVASGWLHILNTRTSTFKYITPDQGLPPSAVVSFVKDRKGNIWIGTLDGICRYDMKNNLVSTFGSADGVVNDHCQPNATRLLHDGRILFGTTTDLLVVDPNKIIIPEITPPVVVSSFFVSNKALRVDSLLQLKKITLPYHNSSIAIDLSTLTYTHTYGIVHQMVGIDKEWQMNAGKQAMYNYLAPGTYTFRTRLWQEKDVPEKVTELTIVITPPFWGSWWFYGLLLLCGLAILYFIDKNRISRIKQTQELRTDIALNLHQDVNTTLNNINLLSEMARIKADNDVARSKELIDRISEKSNSMIVAMDDVLWAIDPANDTMEKMALRLREYTDTLRLRYDAEINTQADKKIRRLKLDMKRRYGLFVVFKEALRCLVEYMGGRKTQIQLSLSNHQLSLKIKDETALDQDHPMLQGSIDAMRARAEEMNALLDIQTDKHGADIVLQIPLQ
ncbi:MAG: ligand-binding sensor domain-containing protein [Chitinophagaceae bacterium]